MDYEQSAFTEQVEAYLKTHKRLPYCAKCPRPHLCLICMSGIGEALLIQKIFNRSNATAFTN